jgi:hypothetical protein
MSRPWRSGRTTTPARCWPGPVPDEVRSLIRDTEQSVSALLDERPLAGVEALRSLATWAGATVDRLAGSLGATAPGTITKGPGRPPPGRALGL